MDYLGTTGIDSLAGADILKCPAEVQLHGDLSEQQGGPEAEGVAQVHLANLGTRVFYLDHGFDTHASQLGEHAKLWEDVSGAIEAFFTDLREHHAADNVLMFLFTEFGRRVHDNGSGTDHGAAGAAFAIGDPVQGGQYSEHPSLRAEEFVAG